MEADKETLQHCPPSTLVFVGLCCVVFLRTPWREVQALQGGLSSESLSKGTTSPSLSLAVPMPSVCTRSCRVSRSLSLSLFGSVRPSSIHDQEPANLKRQSLRFPPVTHQWSGGHVTERNTLPVMEPVDGKPLGNPRFYKHDLLQVRERRWHDGLRQ